MPLIHRGLIRNRSHPDGGRIDECLGLHRADPGQRLRIAPEPPRQGLGPVAAAGKDNRNASLSKNTIDGRPCGAAGAQHGDGLSLRGKVLPHGRGESGPVRVRAPEPPAFVLDRVYGADGAGILVHLVEEVHDGPLHGERDAHAGKRLLPDHPDGELEVFHTVRLVAGTDPHGPEGRVDHQRREAVPHGVAEEGVLLNAFLHDDPCKIPRIVFISPAVSCPGADSAPSSRLA